MTPVRDGDDGRQLRRAVPLFVRRQWGVADDLPDAIVLRASENCQLV